MAGVLGEIIANFAHGKSFDANGSEPQAIVIGHALAALEDEGKRTYFALRPAPSPAPLPASPLCHSASSPRISLRSIPSPSPWCERSPVDTEDDVAEGADDEEGSQVGATPYTDLPPTSRQALITKLLDNAGIVKALKELVLTTRKTKLIAPIVAKIKHHCFSGRCVPLTVRSQNEMHNDSHPPARHTHTHSHARPLARPYKLR